MAYEYHESYKHKLAKELLHQWLTEVHQVPNVDGSTETVFGRTLPFAWRRNYGVHMELPFHKTSDPYYFELSEGICHHKSEMVECSCDVDAHGFIKDFDRGPILFVPDITIFHKGTPTILIEVVHTSPLTKKKIQRITDFFVGFDVTVWEISADSILNCTNKNISLDFKVALKTYL